MEQFFWAVVPSILVSVVMGVYNKADYVGSSLRSVLAQTYGHFELIVVDDASTDDTAAVMTAITDPRVRYVRKEHGGAAAARNRGIAEAKGEFIAFQDSDDVWHSDKLEKQLALLYIVAFFVQALFDNGFNP